MRLRWGSLKGMIGHFDIGSQNAPASKIIQSIRSIKSISDAICQSCWTTTFICSCLPLIVLLDQHCTNTITDWGVRTVSLVISYYKMASGDGHIWPQFFLFTVFEQLRGLNDYPHLSFTPYGRDTELTQWYILYGSCLKKFLLKCFRLQAHATRLKGETYTEIKRTLTRCMNITLSWPLTVRGLDWRWFVR